jgi:hypothetical protein
MSITTTHSHFFTNLKQIKPSFAARLLQLYAFHTASYARMSGNVEKLHRCQLKKGTKLVQDTSTISSYHALALIKIILKVLAIQMVGCHAGCMSYTVHTVF